MINISLDLIDPNYVKAIISNHEQEIGVFGSHFTDVIEEMISAIIILSDGESSKTIEWQDPPGQYRFNFTREDKEVKLQIIRFDKSFTNINDMKGKVIFEEREDIINLARSLIRTINRMKDKYGIEEYKRITQHNFPTNRVDNLKLQLKELKKNL